MTCNINFMANLHNKKIYSMQINDEVDTPIFHVHNEKSLKIHKIWLSIKVLQFQISLHGVARD